MTRSQSSPVTVAAVQTGPLGPEPERNRQLVLEAARRAAQRGAKLIVLPELASTRYILPDRAAFVAASEPALGPSVAGWTGLAREFGAHVVGGFIEAEAEKLFNSAALVGPEGLVGLYRKSHLWEHERDVFAPGDTGFPVWDTAVGRIGLLICFDLRFPECSRVLALQGAEIICLPTGWSATVNKNPLDRQGFIQGTYLSVAQANVSRVALVCANRAGREDRHTYLGKSLIVDPLGAMAAGPAGHLGPETLLARLDLNEARSKKYGLRSDLFGDRRVDLYDRLLGYSPRPRT